MLLRNACAAVDPDEIGTRSRTPNCVVIGSGSHAGSVVRVGGSEWSRTEVVAQRGARVVRPEQAAFLQQRYDVINKRVEPARRDVWHQNESVAGIGLDEVVDRRCDGLG